MGMRFAADGRHLAIWTLLGGVVVWDVRNGALLDSEQRKDPSKDVVDVALPGNGQVLVLWTMEEVAGAWPMGEEKALAQLTKRDIALEGDVSWKCGAFSRDGSVMAVGALVFSGDESEEVQGIVRVVRISDGRSIFETVEDSKSPTAIALGPDNLLAVAWGEQLVLYDINLSREIRRFPANHEEIGDIFISPTGEYLATIFGDRHRGLLGDHRVHVFETAHGKEVTTLGGNWYRVDTVAFLPVTTDVVMTGGGTWRIRRWDVKTGTVLQDPEGPGPLKDGKKGDSIIAVSPDEKILASATPTGRVRLWNLDDCMLRLELNYPKAEPD